MFMSYDVYFANWKRTKICVLLIKTASLTETADRHRKTAAMVLPIIGGLHSLISVPAFE